MNTAMQPTDSDILRFYAASEALDPRSSSRRFTALSSIARFALMGAFQGEGVIAPDTVQGVFSMEDEEEHTFPSYSTSTFSVDEMTTRERKRLSHLSSAPGMEHTAGFDFLPRPGEFCMLVTEGSASHICAVIVFRVSVSEGRRRSIEERQWPGEKPGPTLDLKLVYRAAITRRHADPEQEQKLHMAIAASHATAMTHAVRRTNEGLVAQGASAWVTISSNETDEDVSDAHLSHALLWMIEDGISLESEWILGDGLPYDGLDGIEAA